jgi:superfamily II DNA or RNA helicase
MREIIQQEAVNKALQNHRGALSLPMRSGKTLVGLTIASNFKNVLVVYPNVSIKQSWVDDIAKFNMPSEHITFTTYLSLSKYDLNEYDCVILDEVQDCSVKSWEHIAPFINVRLYALSGTMPNKGEKLIYLKQLCPIIYHKSLDETVGHLQKDYTIYVHMLEPSNVNDIKLSSGKFWSEKAKINFWENKYNFTRSFPDMLQLIRAISSSPSKYKYLKKLMSTMGRGLIFVETSEQADNLGIPTYHSKCKDRNKNLTDFQKGKIDQLATINQLKAGITFPDLTKCVILHCYSSNNKAAQKLGRCLNYVEDEKAEIHIIGLKGTRDEQWINSGLADFDKDKIKYIDAKL